MSAGHTLGPLEACGNLVRTQRNADGSGGHFVAEFYISSEHRNADAVLFVAAQDLLQAGIAVVDAWDRLHGSVQYTPGVGDMMEDIEFREMQALRAAIAKATGE